MVTTRSARFLSVLLAVAFLLPAPAALASPGDALGDGVGVGVGGGIDIEAIALQDYTAMSTGLPTSGDYNFVVAGDINGDGYADLVGAAGQYPSGSVNTYGLWAYTYDPTDGGWDKNSSGLPGNAAANGVYGGIALGDLDGDGDLDLVAGGEGWGSSQVKGVNVHLNNGTVGGALSWVAATRPETNNYYDQVVIRDVNGDGDMDIVAASHGNGIKVWAGDGGSGTTFVWTAKATNLPTTGEYTGIAVADMNGDDDLDILATDYNGARPPIHLWTGNGAGTWTSRDSNFTSTSTENTFGVAAGDVNEDGDMDIVYAMQSSGVVCLLGNGGGSVGGGNFEWTTASSGLPTSGTYTETNLVDMDRDGDLDILVARPSGGVELYLGNGGAGGSQSWSKASKKLPTSGAYYGACVGDFNKDRFLDVAGAMWGDASTGGLRAWKGNITGLGDPVARAVWYGKTTNATDSPLSTAVRLDGTKSSDEEDAPSGDASGTLLTYEWNITKKPAGSTLTDASLSPSDKNATPSFTPDRAGNYSVSLAVKDKDGHWSTTAYAELRAYKPNEPPVAVAGPDQAVHTGDLVSLDGSTSYDTDGAVAAWQWNQSTSNPVQVFLQDAALPEAGFQAPTTVGVYAFTLVVRDDNDTWSAEDEVNVTVNLAPNVLPLAIAPNDFQAIVNRLVKLNGSSSYDPDGGTIVAWDWNCTNRPALPITGADTEEASFTPVLPGVYMFTLVVQDDRGGWSAESKVNVTVVQTTVNVPPVAEIAGAALRTEYVGNNITVDGSPSRDDDGAVVEYRWNCTSHPTLAFIGQNTSAITFKPLDPADYVFTLAVRDDNNTWSQSEDMVTVRVVRPPVNALPIARVSGPLPPIRPGDRVYLDGSESSDSDGRVVAFKWTCISHTTLSFDGQGTYAATFTPADTGDYTFTLEVQDDLGAWSTNLATFTVPVRVNVRPTAVITGPSTGVPGENVTLSAATSTDDDGSVVAWKWEVTDPAGYAMTGADTAEMTFKPSSARDYTVSLVVQDNEGAWSASAERTVDVGRVDYLPVARAGTDTTVRVGRTVELNGGTSSDAEGPIAAYRWRCTSHPNAAGFRDDDKVIATFQPEAAATYTFTLEVQDGAGQWSTPDSITVRVLAPNEPPALTILKPTSGETSLVNGKLFIEWSASDPNGDQMRFTVEVFRGMAQIGILANLGNAVRNISFNDSSYNFPRGVDLEVRITAREYGTEDLYETTQKLTGVRVVDPITNPPGDDEEQGNRNLIIGALVLVVVLAIVGYIMLSKGGGVKAPPARAPPETGVGPAPRAVATRTTGRGAMAQPGPAAASPAAAAAAPARKDPRGRMLDCPQCGAPLDHSNDFGRPYCEECDKYF